MDEILRFAQNDGGFVVAWKLSWRFALDAIAARMAREIEGD
jgi:hypothetical protein